MLALFTCSLAREEEGHQLPRDQSLKLQKPHHAGTTRLGALFLCPASFLQQTARAACLWPLIRTLQQDHLQRTVMTGAADQDMRYLWPLFRMPYHLPPPPTLPAPSQQAAGGMDAPYAALAEPQQPFCMADACRAPGLWKKDRTITHLHLTTPHHTTRTHRYFLPHYRHTPGCSAPGARCCTNSIRCLCAASPLPPSRWRRIPHTSST